MITNNTFTNIGDRIIRFNNIAEGTNITITDNTATNSGDDTGEVIKATSIAEGVTTAIYSNNWGPGTTVGNDEFQDTAAPSSGGSSSYTITTKDTDNGSISVSPSRASSGRIVTITVEPDEGYELDELTVTDSDGDEIDVERVSSTKYTFEMPKSKVTVEAVFVEEEKEPVAPEMPFVDVAENDYYYDAVLWAITEGVTGGTSATTFSPEMICNRAQMVTFLWSAAGSPKVEGTMPFTDVAADAYYYDAVLWAVSEGVTGGTSATTYSPDALCQRCQIITFLYHAYGDAE